VAAAGSIPPEVLQTLASALRYEGSPHHKLHPGDYHLVPPVNPRPTKSPCDELRQVQFAEASALFQKGIILGMVSPFEVGSTPKFVWAVDEAAEVYEAKTKPPDTLYHGYRIGEDERDMRRYILAEWKLRCPQV